MSEGRGLLTEKERRAIAGELSDSYRYKTRSYYRARLDELEKDVDVLAAEAHDLLEELRDVVCSVDTQPPRERRESVETRPRDEREQPAARVSHTPTTAAHSDVIDDAVDKAAESWEDNEARLAARKNAARAVLEGLRERPMSRGEMVERYYDDYDISGQSEDTWYRKNLAECENAPLKAVASYNSGTRKWEFDASGGDR